MSDILRIALVAEGITDYTMLRGAIESMLGGRSFDLKLLQPEGSVAFTGGGNAGPLGGGWKGVCQWCRQAADRGDGRLNEDVLFLHYDLLVLHLDADVANESPAGDDPELRSALPCAQPCPPASASTNPLRTVLLAWAGETSTPPRTVLCTPSKSTEAWVMAAFFPQDREMQRKGWECYPNPASRLAQQPLRERFAKSEADYEQRRREFQASWPRIAGQLSEAGRFRDEFLATIAGL